MLRLLITIFIIALFYHLFIVPSTDTTFHPSDFMDRFFPNALVAPHHPDFYNLEIPLRVPRTTKNVIYWAADGGAWNATVMPVNLAYNRYDNSGVAEVDNGLAILRLASPQPYSLPDGVILKPHLHYRLLDKNETVSPTYQLFLPTDKEHLAQRQKLHSTKFAYLPPVNLSN